MGHGHMVGRQTKPNIGFGQWMLVMLAGCLACVHSSMDIVLIIAPHWWMSRGRRLDVGPLPRPRHISTPCDLQIPPDRERQPRTNNFDRNSIRCSHGAAMAEPLRLGRRLRGRLFNSPPCFHLMLDLRDASCPFFRRPCRRRKLAGRPVFLSRIGPNL